MQLITITTYVDKEKLLVEKYQGEYLEQEESYIINYIDKNKKNFKIVIDKNKDNVSIVKDNTTMAIKKQISTTNYSTNYGVVQLKTELQNIEKLEKNNFVQFEIDYKIYFSKIDSQYNKLKLLIKKAAK